MKDKLIEQDFQFEMYSAEYGNFLVVSHDNEVKFTDVSKYYTKRGIKTPPQHVILGIAVTEELASLYKLKFGKQQLKRFDPVLDKIAKLQKTRGQLDDQILNIEQQIKELEKLGTGNWDWTESKKVDEDSDFEQYKKSQILDDFRENLKKSPGPFLGKKFSWDAY